MCKTETLFNINVLYDTLAMYRTDHLAQRGGEVRAVGVPREGGAALEVPEVDEPEDTG